MILLLNSLIEGAVGIFFLFYPAAAEPVTGWLGETGLTEQVTIKMYGVAALFLATLSAIGYAKRNLRPVYLLVTGMLAGFHLTLAAVLFLYHPDQRAMLLHFLLGIFLAGRYFQRKRLRGSAARL